MKRKKHFKYKQTDQKGNAWVLSTKRPGDVVAGWLVDDIYEGNTRCLESSERCQLTSFCYPTGAKVVQARLLRA